MRRLSNGPSYCVIGRPGSPSVAFTQLSPRIARHRQRQDCPEISFMAAVVSRRSRDRWTACCRTCSAPLAANELLPGNRQATNSCGDRSARGRPSAPMTARMDRPEAMHKRPTAGSGPGSSLPAVGRTPPVRWWRCHSVAQRRLRLRRSRLAGGLSGPDLACGLLHHRCRGRCA